MKKSITLLFLCLTTTVGWAASANFSVEISLRQHGELKSLQQVGLTKDNVKWTLTNKTTGDVCMTGSLASGESWRDIPMASLLTLNMAMFDKLSGWKGGHEMELKVEIVGKEDNPYNGLFDVITFAASPSTVAFMNRNGVEAGIVIEEAESLVIARSLVHFNVCEDTISRNVLIAAVLGKNDPKEVVKSKY